jgi:hypothetical protein
MSGGRNGQKFQSYFYVASQYWKAESFYNSWRTLIPRVNEHGKSFSTNNIRESLKLN